MYIFIFIWHFTYLSRPAINVNAFNANAHETHETHEMHEAALDVGLASRPRFQGMVPRRL